MTSPTSDTFLFDSIHCPENVYYEGYDGLGHPRKSWQDLLLTLSRKSSSELSAYHEKAKRMRHENGATINPFDDLTEQTTAWALDMVPLPLSEQEWGGIEAGVKQRAHLLEAVLKDLYGPQDLLKNSKIPSELVFANPNFLHQCHGIQPSGGRFLTHYAMDIYRGSDGQFRVLRDYGSNPAGLGFALENRIVMSRLFSKLYHRSQIRRLAPFFQAFQNALSQRISLGKDNPGIVLITEGPNSSLYFEHAMLSRYLGYPLVEGQDLTVRNGKVYLKKLTGLEPVEAIFRYVDDRTSDPFALRNSSISGVAGLIQVCREQNIEIVNPIGAGFIDTPALSTILPGLSRHLRGEELLLTNHQSWWCGSEEGIAKFEENIANRTVHSALHHGSILLSNQQELIENLRKSPTSYMVSDPVLPSYAPGWSDGGATGSYCILRVFACATEHGFAVLPGGLAIDSPDIGTLLNSPPEQQNSRDIWVISEEPVDPFSMMDNFSAIPKFKRTSDLPNRVADNLLWLGRYLERAEGLIRLLRTFYDCLSGEDKLEEIPELDFLLTILHAKQIIPNKVTTDGEQIDEAELLMQLEDALYDINRPGSVSSILRNVRHTAHKVRDKMSIDSSRIINRLEGFRRNVGGDSIEQLDQTLITLNAFSGLAMESMTRGLGWRFMDMGRRLERAMHIASLIRVSASQLCDGSFYTLQSLLRILDSLMTYRGRYRSAFQVAPVLDLLLADEGNPKSLGFQLASLADHVEYLPQEDDRRFANREERIVLEMLTATRLLDLTTIVCDQNQNDFAELSKFLVTTEEQLTDFSQQVTAHYLSQIPTTPHYSVISKDGNI